MLSKRIIHWMRDRMLWAVLWGVLGTTGGVLAQDQIIERSYFEDASGTLTLQDVQHKAFIPYNCWWKADCHQYCGKVSSMKMRGLNGGNLAHVSIQSP